ncbi:chromatin associated protein KTI12 [Staphylotrichum tortipilum]|uniref:Chromatin associated protein KTI12 n=1 Tax=Staphylotrichum tortipilum TaxID=2831512 RepID=A0AAN6RS24_9PEZI|nr:chromatin associated protein KTI12 [Staphylotrichum longicolle]
MPLIIITGLPTSGKTTRARELVAYLTSRVTPPSPSQQQPQQPSQSSQPPQPSTPQYRIHLLSDTTLSIPRTVYDLSTPNQPAHTRSANAPEKDARAALYAAVKRALSPRDIVVLDALNYIKGWRYQLFCEAKNLGTPCCVLQVGPGGEGGGVERARGEAYGKENWENLVFRYEEPNPMTRWDSPLFTLVWDDDEARARGVYDQIWEAVAGEARKTVRPNQSTVPRDKDPGGDYLYVLERETQDIVKRILERQPEDGSGGEVRLPRMNGGVGVGAGQKGGEEELVVELPGKKVGLPQLQRYRRAFVALNRGGIGLEAVGKLAAGRLRESFVGYLNDAFEKDG